MPTIVPISFRESSKNVAVNFRRIIQKKGPNSPGNEFRNNSEHYYFVLRSVQLRASIELFYNFPRPEVPHVLSQKPVKPLFIGTLGKPHRGRQ